ncbi:MAG TPA: trypsin-like peptidase domain-containing protein [Tepidisphaeraceae bacterium]|nr:trypsin-like peptidase domain-containing protein [Tepidisphaeraceae bacterium]
MQKDPRPSISTLLILLGIFLLLGYELSKWSAQLFRSPATEVRSVAARGDLADDEKSTIALFKAASPSVVYITTLAERLDLRSLNVFQIPQGTGSGFVWDDAGDIVTNYHVLAGQISGVRVTLANHKSYDAVPVGGSPDDDLAVLRINAPREELTPIAIGSSKDLQVGQKVFAIGNPFGLDQTLTTGIVSARGRTIEAPSGQPIPNAIQTDAAINPGNSGGPLLDSAGRLIGVNTSIPSQRGFAGGIGFAIPVDTVNRIVAQLIANGRIIRPELGVLTSDITSQDITRRLGISGVLVIEVEAGSPAAKAGIRPARRLPNGSISCDIVQTINGQKVHDIESLHREFQKQPMGKKIPITLLRDGKPMTLEVEVFDWKHSR